MAAITALIRDAPIVVAMPLLLAVHPNQLRYAFYLRETRRVFAHTDKVVTQI